MNAQEVITIFAEIPSTAEHSENAIIQYPQLNAMFEKGMYIESFNKIYVSNRKYLITFVFRQATENKQ